MSEEAPAAEGQVVDTAPEAQGQAETQTVWYDTAPDDVKGYIQNKGWDDPIKAVTSYKELEKFQGASPEQLIKLPKDGEPMDEVYNRLGRPVTPDEYSYESPTGELDEARLGLFKEAAHKAGVSQEAFKALAEADSQYWAQAQEAHFAEIEQKQTAELTKLKGEWGAQFDERAELGRRFVSKNIPEGMDKEGTLNAIEDAIGTAAMLKLFANAGDKASVREDRLPDGEGERRFGYTPEQATHDKRELMQTIQADPARLANYNTGKGPDIDKIKKLNQIIAG